ncbi:hypothetical protein BDB00DRAFT_486360 [Zychaea mexicana]|uniref:uncharacterized protein n=1 Tax=Zychaea mexicana TaxID=64656 RepID=UPI0022FE78BA|nr:uncharacterized protein BDB00DRAFT_486360 [Zychaea mexicana]KAI9491518.1 hypothetical protein BDB00DRAFT_486360 [Zychaea mexicana]
MLTDTFTAKQVSHSHIVIFNECSHAPIIFELNGEKPGSAAASVAGTETERESDDDTKMDSNTDWDDYHIARTTSSGGAEIEGQAMDEEAESEEERQLEPSVTDMEPSTASAAVAPKGIESNQSYWLFGDSFNKFKTASTTVLDPNQEQDEMLVQMTIAKRSLKEILSVYLRMAIPGETLASSIGPPVCDMIIQFFLQHQPSVTSDMDVDAVINDTATDTFDVLMTTLWEAEEGRDKMVDLVGSIAHHCGDSRHVIGMRWWSYVAGRVVEGTRDWIPSIVKSYKAFVSLAYPDDPIELSLTRDLQLLAEQNHTSFHNVLLIVYQYMPGSTVGNTELLQMLLTLILPDQLGQLVTLVRSGILRVYGDPIDIAFLVSTFRLDAYETACAWQILVAELQGNQKRTENFLSMPDTIALLQSQTLDQVSPQLLSLFSAAQPTPALLEATLQVIPPANAMRDKIQLLMTVFIDWKQQQKSSAALERSMQSILDLVEAQNMNDETTRQLARQLSILQQ